MDLEKFGVRVIVESLGWIWVIGLRILGVGVSSGWGGFLYRGEWRGIWGGCMVFCFGYLVNLSDRFKLELMELRSLERGVLWFWVVCFDEVCFI